MQSRKVLVSSILAINLLLILFYSYVSNLSSTFTLDHHDVPTPQQPRDAALNTPNDPNERYLAYLPHSGFHNQRISLENALLLSRYLNRTLLVPPVFLGPATEWTPFNVLHRRIMLLTKRGLDHCSRIPKGETLPAECLNYFSWTTLDWDFFYDMDKIRKEQPLKSRTDHSFAWMEAELGIDRKKDIYFFDNKGRYDHQIYDDPNSVTPLNSKFLKRMNVQDLTGRPERVIHMGSLFATGRVLAELPENKAYLDFLRRTMILSTPVLASTSDAMVKLMGGLGSFVGLHVRVGDGMFVDSAPANIENMFQSLVNITGITPLPNYRAAGSTHPGQEEVNHANLNNDKDQQLVVSKPTTRRAPERLSFEECRARKAEGGRYTAIYIATDAVYPRRNVLFRKLFDHFPCIFALDDFSNLLGELVSVKNTDGVALTKDLIPMLDAVASAKGRYFMGTPKSTFSSYVAKQLHPAFIEGLYDLDGNPL